MATLQRFALMACVLCVSGSHAYAAEWYVATSGSDAAAGTNWVTAKATIQAAIDLAGSNDTVWVSNGVYASGGRVVPGFALTNRVVIDKPIQVQSVNGPAVTVIQGAKPNGAAAVRCVYVGTNAVWSGFTLSNGATHTNGNEYGYFDQEGGGAWCEASGVMSNCTLTSNSASLGGGGVTGGTLNNCTISGNSAYTGGGSDGSTLNNCTVTGNSASKVGQYGVSGSGGGAAWGTLTDCTISGNSAESAGGAQNCSLIRCIISNNQAKAAGGVYDSDLFQCVITHNRVYTQSPWIATGGGAHQSDLDSCLITQNSSSHVGGGVYECRLWNCTLSGNRAGKLGGGAFNTWTLTNCIISSNYAGEVGGGAYGGQLNNCLLTDNTAVLSGGGVGDGWYNGNKYTLWLENCTLKNNTAGGGGGIAGYYNTIINSVLIGNVATNAGGGSAGGGTMYNCTLIANRAWSDGGGLAGGKLVNCIVFGNFLTNGVLSNWTNAQMDFTCTDPLPTNGVGNITSDPQFMNMAAGDYRLSTNSPCIDQGNNVHVWRTSDFDGNPRIVNGVVDMGAYESQFLRGYWAWASGITNGLTDYADCATGDGYPNLLKYVTGSSPSNSDELSRLDCTKSNGVPVLIFHRNTNAEDATLIVQGAFAISNGAIWLGLATNINGSWSGASNVTESPTGNPVVCTVEDPMQFLTNRFLRLKVTRK